MLTYNQLENYALEIISRARSIRKTCEFLLSHTYSSEAPKNLADTIIRICAYLEDAIVSIQGSTESDEDGIGTTLDIFRIIDLKIKKIGAHVRYIDGARTERLPWSIIPAFQKRIKKLLPQVHIMLRPQWKYNYSIDLTDLWIV